MTQARLELWYGRSSVPAVRHKLRAGPLSAVLEGADLRRVRIGGVEVAQRIYVAVRDEAWNTIPAVYDAWRLDIAEDHFAVEFQARHRHREIDFSWQGRITGSADGAIAYSMDGVARGAFHYSKIGFNVHHPLQGAVGRPYWAETDTGPLRGVLPEWIDPQRVVAGRLTAMFAPYSALAIEVQDGLTARFDFEGDLFELQDHRNWTDSNFKSYGTPLSIPLPLEIHPGQELHQRVTISVNGSTFAPADNPQVRMEIGAATGRLLPPIGTCLAGHDDSLSHRETDLLRALRLDHLRVDLDLEQPGWKAQLREASDTCAAIGAHLEAALFVGEEADASLARLASLLPALDVDVARILVFPAVSGRSVESGSTPGVLVRQVRDRLRDAAPGAPVAGGTKLFFAEINRNPPECAAMDGLVFSINPQVHACDDTSLIENLESQADVVRSAQALCAGLPIFISPVTFIGRDGPYAAGPPAADGLPGNVDVRQASLFGAGWTVGSIGRLAAGGAAALTYYETTGWLGLIERERGSPMPDRFPSTPGMVFPLYHVLADVGEWKGAQVLDLAISDPLIAAGLAVQDEGGMHAVVANLTDQPRTIRVGPMAGSQARVRVLDEQSAPQALGDSERFRGTGTVVDLAEGYVRLTLTPYALARVDQAVEP